MNYPINTANVVEILRENRGKTPAEVYKILAKEIVREAMDKRIAELLIAREESPNNHRMFGYEDEIDKELEQVDF